MFLGLGKEIKKNFFEIKKKNFFFLAPVVCSKVEIGMSFYGNNLNFWAAKFFVLMLSQMGVA